MMMMMNSIKVTYSHQFLIVERDRWTLARRSNLLLLLDLFVYKTFLSLLRYKFVHREQIFFVNVRTWTRQIFSLLISIGLKLTHLILRVLASESGCANYGASFEILSAWVDHQNVFIIRVTHLKVRCHLCQSSNSVLLEERIVSQPVAKKGN